MTDEQLAEQRKILFDDTVDLLIERGYDESSLMEDYSGRAMYGKTCAAIVTDAPPVAVGIAFAVACLRCELAVADEMTDLSNDAEELMAIHQPKRIDSMGKSSHVFY